MLPEDTVPFRISNASAASSSAATAATGKSILAAGIADHEASHMHAGAQLVTLKTLFEVGDYTGIHLTLFTQSHFEILQCHIKSSGVFGAHNVHASRIPVIYGLHACSIPTVCLA